MPDTIKSERSLRRRAAALAKFEWSGQGERWLPCSDAQHAVVMLKGGYLIREVRNEYNEGDSK